jgi:NAD(P) transhydrogenase subunit alpha
MIPRDHVDSEHPPRAADEACPATKWSAPLRIGVPRETKARETRVAATPATVAKLVGLGYDVVVESGAGQASSFPDEAYAGAGAAVGTADDAWQADVVLRVNAPAVEEIGRLREGATLVSLLSPALNPDLVDALAARPITVLAMDAVPRISRAQSLDVLSSMANIAGYRAVIEAAHTFGRFFTGQVTAAGKVPPAKVLVVGAGVAGVGAIGAASSQGAVVRATATPARCPRTSTGGPPRCTPSRPRTSTSSSRPR